MSHKQPITDAAELAALYLSGAMTGEERESFEAALTAGRAEFVAEVQRLQEAVLALGDEVEPVEPSPAVRQKLLRQIDERDALHAQPTDQPRPKRSDEQSANQVRQQIWRGWGSDDAASDALFTLRAADGAWEDTGVAGVQVRRLFVDRASNRMTAMFRMAPGAAYPVHVHDGPEECYVLQGDLHVGRELVMRAGDYQRATPGSEHGTQWTENGCLLLVTSSLSDEMV